MTLVRVQIQMIESKVQQTDFQTTYFLCDSGHQIAKQISKSPVLILKSISSTKICTFFYFIYNCFVKDICHV